MHQDLLNMSLDYTSGCTGCCTWETLTAHAFDFMAIHLHTVIHCCELSLYMPCGKQASKPLGKGCIASSPTTTSPCLDWLKVDAHLNPVHRCVYQCTAVENVVAAPLPRTVSPWHSKKICETAPE